jgi:hypothetical protein
MCGMNPPPLREEVLDCVLLLNSTWLLSLSGERGCPRTFSLLSPICAPRLRTCPSVISASDVVLCVCVCVCVCVRARARIYMLFEPL